MYEVRNSMARIMVKAILPTIKPLEKTAPQAMPRLATIIIVLKDIALEPKAEFKKLTASLLTPSTKSAITKTARAILIKKYM